MLGIRHVAIRPSPSNLQSGQGKSRRDQGAKGRFSRPNRFNYKRKRWDADHEQPSKRARIHGFSFIDSTGTSQRVVNFDDDD